MTQLWAVYSHSGSRSTPVFILRELKSETTLSAGAAKILCLEQPGNFNGPAKRTNRDRHRLIQTKSLAAGEGGEPPHR